MPHLKAWQPILERHAIFPVQTIPNTGKKSLTDMALVIDAMDLCYEANLDSFVLISGDSDFIPLVHRLKKSGLKVIGVGNRATTSPKLPKVYDRFFFTDEVHTNSEDTTTASKNGTHSEPAIVQTSIGRIIETLPQKTLQDPLALLLIQAVIINNPNNEWISLSTVGSRLRQFDPGFNIKAYGHKQLLKAIKAYKTLYEARRNKNGMHYVRLCERKNHEQ